MENIVGLKFKAEETVTEEKTALAVGSGGLPVYATPCLSSLMEHSAYELLQQHLPQGSSSVGTSIDLCHSSASPVGMRVWAVCEIVAAEGRSVTFNIKAYDDKGEIGSCVHTRVIIDAGRFLDKAQKKLSLCPR